MILVVDGVEFGYGGRPILRDIKFRVDRGEVLAVLGVNGAGKSTLLKCLNRILKPWRGTVWLDGEDLFRLSALEVARRLGYVAQRHQVTRFTVFDAVLLGRRPHLKWGITRRDLEVTHRALKLLELEDYALRYLDELSGGELQKVVIARAFAQEPQVLLLDEPTSNLDLKNQLEVLRLVRRAVQEEGMAAVLVLHDLNLALRFADKFLLLKDRTVYACGGREVMTPEHIAAVYGVPVLVEELRGVPVVVPL
ncbi:ABC transporter ATP-binding protein [Desulfothermobacter acidiphilus]|uniref:ABC transporter ATP-binding protein n=1 Tax=Desulfothermobacter acidiphilus TaxID=1938353 RepID=UPI003F8A58D6